MGKLKFSVFEFGKYFNYNIRFVSVYILHNNITMVPIYYKGNFQRNMPKFLRHDDPGWKNLPT